jgi:hypothetical protein
MYYVKAYAVGVGVALVLAVLALVTVGPANAEEYSAFNVMDLPPGDSAAIVCYPEGDDGETLVFTTSGKGHKATGTTLWQGFVGQRVNLGDVWDATSHVGAIAYGTDRLMYVLHIFDNKTKERVARLFIDFQEPQVFLAGPEPTNEWVYLVWECSRG